MIHQQARKILIYMQNFREHITYPNWEKYSRKDFMQSKKWSKTEPSKWVSLRKKEITENMDKSEWLYLLDLLKKCFYFYFLIYLLKFEQHFFF